MSLVRVLAAKEVRELLKTLRVIILPAVFVFFGIAGPGLIRLLPVLLENLSLIHISEPTRPY